MLKLKGLKDAWEYVLNTIDEELTIDYIKKIHFQVCKGQNIFPLGDFRDKGVGVTGTSWRPKLPIECNYEKELKDIMSISNDLDRCISLFCWIQRSQMFLDGNKRTACLSLKVNFEELGYEFEVKDTILADLTMKVATDKISEEECRKLFENILNN